MNIYQTIYNILMEIYYDPESINMDQATKDCIQIARKNARARWKS